jgi:hypothetical protein
MEKEEFLKLLDYSEGRVIDFKQQMYDLSNDDREQTKLAKLVKDVISFSNTVRTTSSYIITGAKKSDSDNSVELIGIESESNLNESIIQQKVKDKIFPIPHFNYYTISHNSLIFGVFEFPIHKYELPLSPTTKMKGLDVGRPYYRKGSANEEAIGAVAIHIHNWFQSLPSISDENTFSSSIAILLGKSCNIENKLSVVISETLAVANKFKLKFLSDFCIAQLTGLKELDGNDHQYRIVKICFCANKIDEIRPGSTPLQIRNYLKSSKNYWEYNMFFQDSISNIESFIVRTENEKGIVKIHSTTNSLGIEMKKMDITFLIFHDNYISLYNGIRQKLISLLVEVNMNNGSFL